MKQFKHQGDIVFVPFKGKVPSKREKHNGSYIVGYGEATGHHHKVTVKSPQEMEIIKTEGGYILVLHGEGTVTHQEHHPIVLPKGTYAVGHEREVDYFADGVVRRVVD